MKSKTLIDQEMKMNGQRNPSKSKLRAFLRRFRLLGSRKPVATSTSAVPCTSKQATSQREGDFGTSYLVANAMDSAPLGYLAGGSVVGAMLGADAAQARLDARTDVGVPDSARSSSQADCGADVGSSSWPSGAADGSVHSDSGWICDSSSSLGSSSDSSSSSGSSSFDCSSDGGSSSFDSGSNGW